MTSNPSSETPFSLKAQLSVNANINSQNQNQNQNNQRYRYQSEIQAMMYTFGDVRHPLSSTSLLIEDIVHSQIIELVHNEQFITFIISSFCLVNKSIWNCK